MSKFMNCVRSWLSSLEVWEYVVTLSLVLHDLPILVPEIQNSHSYFHFDTRFLRSRYTKLADYNQKNFSPL